VIFLNCDKSFIEIKPGRHSMRRRDKDSEIKPKNICSCGGEMVPEKGGYHPGTMYLKCTVCGNIESGPCTCEGQAGYCDYCGEQLDPFMNI